MGWNIVWNKCSDRSDGSVTFPALLRNNNSHTDRPTNQPTVEHAVHREATNKNIWHKFPVQTTYSNIKLNTSLSRKNRRENYI